MNYKKAEQQAKYLFISTGIPHVVTETNGIYSVHTEREWTGKIVKKYSHAKEIINIPELRATTDTNILQDSGNERPKSTSKRGANKG